MGTGCGIFCGTGLFGEPAMLQCKLSLVNTEAILASHEAMHMVMVRFIKLYSIIIV